MKDQGEKMFRFQYDRTHVQPQKPMHAITISPGVIPNSVWVTMQAKKICVHVFFQFCGHINVRLPPNAMQQKDASQMQRFHFIKKPWPHKRNVFM